MKKWIFILTSFFVSMRSSYGQSVVDSLKKVLETNIPDTTRFNMLYTIAYFYLEANLDSGMLYGKRAYQISSSSTSKRIQFLGLERMGSILWRRGDVQKSIEFFLDALQIAQEIKDSTGVSIIYFDLGNAYNSESDDKTALSYYFKSLGHLFTNGMKGRTLMKIGSIYLNSGKLDLALSYAQESYEIFKSPDHSPGRDLASTLNLLVNSYSGSRYLSPSLNLLGNIKMKSGDAKVAYEYYKMGAAEGYANHNLNGAADNNLSIARIFRSRRNFDSAYFYGIAAYRNAKDVNSPYKIEEITNFLTDLFTEQNKIDSAFTYQSIMIAAKDSILNIEKIRQIQNLSFAEQQRQQELKKSKIEFQNKIKLYAAGAGMLILLIVSYILYSSNRNKQKAYTLLQKQKKEIDVQKSKAENTLEELRATQAQLIQSEKMASLGELTAGIAHEIQNPLNFVNNFSEVNKELIGEIKSAVDSGRLDEIKTLANNIHQNEEKILLHGKRADAIVKSMLQHTRSSGGKKELIHVNAMCDEYLRLAHHGFRAKDKTFKAKLETDFDTNIGEINVIPQDIARVLLNLINNAFYAVTEKKQQSDISYEPCVSIRTTKLPGKVEIAVRDNGNGIPDKLKDKIFQPFFTTKPTGQGTGLGLSLAYDIVKAHGGEIRVKTIESEGTEFIIELTNA